MIEVKFTIAGAPYENIKVTLTGNNYGELFAAIGTVESISGRLFQTYEKLVEVRDSGHREAVDTVLAELPGAVVETETLNVSDEGARRIAEDEGKPFWDSDPNPLPHTKPWERTSAPGSTTPATTGQTVNLL